MNCPNIEKLNNYANGKLSSEELLEISNHISECKSCNAYINQQIAVKKAICNLGDNLLSIEDCPEYEVLSAYVSKELSSKETVKTLAHINSCELCFDDVKHIEELRAASLLRGNIMLSPQHKKSSNWIFGWKGAFVTATVLGSVLFGILNKPVQVPVPIVKVDRVAQAPAKIEPKQIAANPALPVKTAVKTIEKKPSYEIIAKDRNSVIVRKKGKISIASAKDPEKTIKLSSKISRFVSQKLKFGKVNPIETVNLAAANVFVRSGESSGNSISAPKLISPVKKLVISEKPLFEWSANDLAYEYKIVVTDKIGNVVLDQITSKNRYKAASALDRSKLYLWRVGIRFGSEDEFTYSTPSTFRIISAQAVSDIEKAQQIGSRLVLGSVYEAYGLNTEAENEYLLFNNQNPKSDILIKGR